MIYQNKIIPFSSNMAHIDHIVKKMYLILDRFGNNLFQIPPREFTNCYRFSKNEVHCLLEIVRPHLNADANNHSGLPFEAEEIVCSDLNILWGAHFQRTEGLWAGTVSFGEQEIEY